MTKLIDLTGKKFGNLVVIKRAEDGPYGVRWLCLCDCGNEVIKYGSLLRRGSTTSCGCFGKERQREAVTRHGLTHTPIYRAWDAMKRRCQNPSTKFYEEYGGRGISVCDEWQEFEPFRDWAFENGYSEDLSIDRIDNNGNYCPENCRWTDMHTQSRNKRNNVWITFNGKTMIMSDWANEIGITPYALWNRLKNHSIEEALTMPHEFHARRVKCK